MKAAIIILGLLCGIFGRRRHAAPASPPAKARTPTPHLRDGYWEYVYPLTGIVNPLDGKEYRYAWYFWAWPGAKNLDGRPKTYNGPMKWTERTWTQEGGELPTDKPPAFMDGPPGTDAWNTRTQRWEKAPDPPGIHPWNL